MSLKRKLDDETINLIHHKAWDKQIEKYGSAVAVPREKADLIAERDRAMSVSYTHLTLPTILRV